MFSPSVARCRDAGTGFLLILLVEVALGAQKELHEVQYLEGPVEGSNSTKVVGTVAPCTEKILPDGCIVPLGRSVPTGATTEKFNEYIIYNSAQAKIRYLLKLKRA